jgi:hypothetical protein
MHPSPSNTIRRSRRCPLALAAALWMALAAASAPAGAQNRSFDAEGADTGAGLGARWVAQGGVGVAAADDLYALYYNPAGLASVRGWQLSVSRQLNAELHRINALALSWRSPWAPGGEGAALTFAAAYYPRIHARANGAFAASDFESLFLRYLLPGINGTFDGAIDSKTKSYRVAMGYAPAADSPWAWGLYLERIDCRSDFCGVHATSNGFTTQSTGAVANAFGLSLRYRFNPKLTLGASLSDVSTRLTINSITTDAAGTRSSSSAAAFPRKLGLGLAWQATPGWRLAADYEGMKGRYGSSQIDLQTLRFGAEHSQGAWQWRAGAVLPLRIFSSASGTLKTPFPFAPSLGIGWRHGPWRVDAALYAHAVMSMHKDQPRAAADVSLGLAFD